MPVKKPRPTAPDFLLILYLTGLQTQFFCSEIIFIFVAVNILIIAI